MSASRSMPFRPSSARRLCAVLVLVGAPMVVAASGRFVAATVDADGQLRLVRNDGRTIVLAPGPEQVGFDRIAISDDGAAAGWVALYPACCTSYPIPRKLQVHSGRRVRSFTGNGLPIWQWRFMEGGRRVAFRQETVHGGLGVRYELRDVASGRLIAEHEPIIGPDSRPLPDQSIPGWVAAVDGTIGNTPPTRGRNRR